MIETMVSSELFERLVGDTTLTFEQAILNLDEKIAEERTKRVRMEKALRRLTYCNEAVLQYGETYRPDLDKAIEVAKEILA